MIEVTVKNVTELTNAIAFLKKHIGEACTKGIYAGLVEFGSRIEKTQLRVAKSAKRPKMGGSHPAYGLYSWSGQAGLRGAWRVQRKGPNSAQYFFASKYAAIHQFGGVIEWPGTFNGFGKGIPIPPHEIAIPKRLYILEEFSEYGHAMISKNIDQQIDKLFSKLGAA